MIDDALVQAIRDRRAVLFIGAGVSRCLGLPSFRELVASLADELGFDPEVFRELGDAPTLAEYYRLEKRGLGGLRSRLDQEWHEAGIDIKTSEVHRLIRQLGCGVVYTTNWDDWLERSYRQADVKIHTIVNIADLANIPDDAIQIVKYHGDFTDDESLVFTESGYMSRMDFDGPLDTKLRLDAMGKSILFLGYSLRDPNTRLLLFRLKKLWTGNFIDAQPTSYMITDHPNLVQERVLQELSVRSIVPEWADTPAERLAGVLSELVAAAS